MANTSIINDRVKEILTRARKDRNKRRYYVYEQYKSELWDACTSNTEFEQSCIDLATALRV